MTETAGQGVSPWPRGAASPSCPQPEMVQVPRTHTAPATLPRCQGYLAAPSGRCPLTSYDTNSGVLGV